MVENIETKKTLTELTRYLERSLGGTVQIEARANDRKSGMLPVYLDRSYQFYTGSIQGQSLIFAFPTDLETITPGRLKKDAVAISNVLGYPVVFVTEKLEAHQRTRLIQQKTSFIVPGKQLYIPFLVISLTDTEERIQLPKARKLRPASQVLILYHLEKERLDNFNFQTIARKIGYTPMTVKRIVEELQEYGLARKEGKKEKFIRFTDLGRVLWEKAVPYLQSPARIDFFIDKVRPDPRLKKAGLPALSEYTDLAAGAQPVYALYEENEEDVMKAIMPREKDYFGGNIQVEVWHYDPAVLSTGNVVDPLSLYLSLPIYGLDERTQLAKEELLKNIQW